MFELDVYFSTQFFSCSFVSAVPSPQFFKSCHEAFTRFFWGRHVHYARTARYAMHAKFSNLEGVFILIVRFIEVYIFCDWHAAL